MTLIPFNILAINKLQSRGPMHVDRLLTFRSTWYGPEMADPNRHSVSKTTWERSRPIDAKQQIWATTRKEALTVEEAALELGLCQVTVRERCFHSALLDTDTSHQES